MSNPERKVILLGSTGAGKSQIGNELLQNLHAFKPAPLTSNHSQTTQVAKRQSNVGGMKLIVYDTPGMGDTQGRSIHFLDDIMNCIKNEAPHAILFFMNGDAKFTPDVQNALRCFAQCLKPSTTDTLGLPHGRVFLIVNHLKSIASQVGNRYHPTTEEQAQLNWANAVDDNNNTLTKNMEMTTKLPFEHTFGIDSDPAGDSLQLYEQRTKIYAALLALPDEPLDVGQFRTFTNVMTEAVELSKDAISADDWAGQRIGVLQYFISWHQRRISDCKIAIAATWIFVLGVPILLAVIAESEAAIPVLREELRNVSKNKKENLEKAKIKAVNWLEEVENLKKAMATKQPLLSDERAQ